MMKYLAVAFGEGLDSFEEAILESNIGEELTCMVQAMLHDPTTCAELELELALVMDIELFVTYL